MVSSEHVSELVRFWRKLDVEHCPFVHPEDSQVIRQYGNKVADFESPSFEEFVRDRRFGDTDDPRFRFSLLPIPYGGDIAKADIFVLLLNPGLSYTDFFAERRMPDFRQRLIRNLRQEFSDVEFPFFWLDPEICWHSGFVWWERKLHDVVQEIARIRFEGIYRDALRDVSKRLAHIELVPYHSFQFGAANLISRLRSVDVARSFVRETLAPSVEQGKKTVIVTRQAASWALEFSSDDLVVYGKGLSRGASLGLRSPGGKAILKRYEIELKDDGVQS